MKKIFLALFLIFILSLLGTKQNASAITSYKEAAEISVNQEYTNTITMDPTTHYYKVSLPADGKFTFQMNYINAHDLYIYIADSNGKKLAEDYYDSRDYDAGRSTTIALGLPKGDYYLVFIQEDYHTNIKYTFNTQFIESDNYEKEFNDSFSAANLMALNTVYYGTFPEKDKADYYKLETPEDGKVKLSMKNVPNNYWSTTIYKDDGTEIKSFKTNSSELVTGNREVELGLPKGIYYIKVNPEYTKKNVFYELSANFETNTSYENEFNNSLTTANPISFNQSYSGNIHNQNDQDFYKFTLNKPGKIDVNMSTMPGASWKVYIQNQEGQVYDSFSTNSGELVSGDNGTSVGLPAGNYYVRITNKSDSTEKPYTFKINYIASNTAYEKEFNNTLITATPINLNTTINGNINDDSSYYSDVDFYKFVLPTASTVKINMTQTPYKAWNNNLYDSKGNEIAKFTTSSKELVSKDYTTTLYLNKGTYYYKVSNASKATWTPYKFKISVLAVTPVAKSVTVKNNKGKKDVITVKGVAKGATVTVYNSKSKKIASKKAASTKVELKVKQLGKNAGTISITVKEPNKTVSTRKYVSFKKER